MKFHHKTQPLTFRLVPQDQDSGGNGTADPINVPGKSSGRYVVSPSPTGALPHTPLRPPLPNLTAASSPIPPADRLFQTLLPHPMRGDRGRKEGLSFHGATRQRVGLPLEIFGQTVVLLQMWVAFFCVWGGNIIFIVIETFITMVSEGRRPTRKRKVCIEIHPARRTHVCFSTRHFELTAWQNAQIEDEVAPKRPPLPHLPHV